jgi:hypothetical protein
LGKGGRKMTRKGYTPEQIIGKLREAEVLLHKGETVGQVCRKIRLKKLVADLSLDNAILKEGARGNF